KKYPLELFPRQRTIFETLFSSDWGTAVEALRGVRALAGGGPLGAAARPGGALGSVEALEEWMRRAAAPQVLARAPEIRIR
ncbi:MAG TPA: hypothetical protein VHR17_11555, partial [Thermoanaerobaculia bacterium]|nr:hypothetical protein [Thermoanaerobaculia bacterium]